MSKYNHPTTAQKWRLENKEKIEQKRKDKKAKKKKWQRIEKKDIRQENNKN